MNQDEYFSVHAGLTLNVEPLAPDESVPEQADFIAEIPPLFRVASECSSLDDDLERALTHFSKPEATGLTQYLAAQNSKINLLLSFVLAQQDDPTQRYTTHTFGASRLTYGASQPLATGTAVRLKIFLDNPAAAVYAYAEVTDCHTEHDLVTVHLRYTRLTEEDQDLLIRAALLFQQKILRQRAQQRSEHQ
ncbi:PilZ domain-containing protein [Photobacterium japonica]|uniref:PilZ domain-containing protein n=1 Tax=Photobacterium japonica TaxID=2910235 RepID=UPI003D0EC285